MEQTKVSMVRLELIYKKDKTMENYRALEAFELFKVPYNMKICEYLK